VERIFCALSLEGLSLITHMYSYVATFSRTRVGAGILIESVGPVPIPAEYQIRVNPNP
jgi:hypothetical protein